MDMWKLRCSWKSNGEKIQGNESKYKVTKKLSCHMSDGDRYFEVKKNISRQSISGG
jgi:hypothetical protein